MYQIEKHISRTGYQTPPPVGTVHLHLGNITNVISRPQILSDGERARAEAFRFKTDRQHFIARRTALRTVLSTYLACPPDQVPLNAPKDDRPRLMTTAQDIVEFSTSSSNEAYVIAIGPGRLNLGVDLETSSYTDDLHEVAKQFFSQSEVDLLAQWTNNDWQRGFLRGWTAREAILKATGEGLVGDVELRAMTIDIAPSPPCNRLIAGPPPHDPEHFHVISMEDTGLGLISLAHSQRLRTITVYSDAITD